MKAIFTYSGSRNGLRTQHFTSVIALTVACAAQAQAQDVAPSASKAGDKAQPAEIAEVIVTAQRRDERLQDVPISVTAVKGAALAAKGVSTPQDLVQVVPSLTVNTSYGRFFPVLRGVGSSITNPGYENAVATYVDGVFISSTVGGLTSLANIERVEVLKGPQGTLFGRNSTGGLIQFITKPPSETPSGQIELGYGNYDTKTADLYVTGGLAPGVAADFAGHFANQGEGYGKNLVTSQDVYKTEEDTAIRASALVTAIDNLRLRVSADYSKLRGALNPVKPAPGTISVNGPFATGGPWDVALDTPPQLDNTASGVTASADLDLGFSTLKSITAYRSSSSLTSIDGDGGPAQTVQVYLDQKDNQVSQEFQLASKADSKIHWIAGAYYFYANSGFVPERTDFFPGFQPPTPFGFIDEDRQNTHLTIESLAGFGQVTAPLGDSTNLTGGLRYTTERRTIEETSEQINIASGPSNIPLPTPPGQSVRVSEPTWRLSIDHRFSPQLLVFASYNRGFKSGGFNAARPTDPAYSPEKIDAYELGFKSDTFERRLRLNLSGFYYNYNDIQIARYLPGTTIIYNGAAARVYGVDADFEARPMSNLTLAGGVSYLDTRFTSFPGAFFYVPNTAPPFGNTIVVANGAGNRLPNAPPFSANLGGRYDVQLPFALLSLEANYYYSGRYYTAPDNVLSQPAYDLVNASATLSFNNRVALRFWGRNLGDKAVATAQDCATTACTIVYRPPRTYGATVRVAF